MGDQPVYDLCAVPANQYLDPCHVGFSKQNTVFATGKSILNRTSKTNIGELMLRYGGGGHENAGTCQISHDQANTVLTELIARITQDG